MPGAGLNMSPNLHPLPGGWREVEGGATAVLVAVVAVVGPGAGLTFERDTAQQDRATKLLPSCSTLVISGKGQQLTRFLLPAAGFLGNLRSVVLRAAARCVEVKPWAGPRPAQGHAALRSRAHCCLLPGARDVSFSNC